MVCCARVMVFRLGEAGGRRCDGGGCFGCCCSVGVSQLDVWYYSAVFCYCDGAVTERGRDVRNVGCSRQWEVVDVAVVGFRGQVTF